MAAGLVIGGSVGIVLTVAGQLSGLHSLETQEHVSAILSGAGHGLGIDLETALGWMRVILMVVAGCATAAAVLGFQVLRRSRGARSSLTLLAMPIFLGGLVTGGFLTSLVAASIALLWVGPSAQWLHDGPPTSNRGFLDRPKIPAPAPADAEQRPPTAPPVPPAGAPPSSHQLSPPSPTARRLFVDSRGCQPVGAGRAAATGRGGVGVRADLGVLRPGRGGDGGDPRAGRRRPGVRAGPTAGAGPGPRGPGHRRTRERTYATAAVLVVWSLAAAVLAVLAYRRRTAGRMGVLVSSAAAGVLCLAGVFASVALMLPAGAAVATVVLLSRPEVRAWYAAREPRMVQWRHERHDGQRPERRAARLGRRSAAGVPAAAPQPYGQPQQPSARHRRRAPRRTASRRHSSAVRPAAPGRRSRSRPTAAAGVHAAVRPATPRTASPR